MKKGKTYLAQLDRLPPNVCVLIARVPGQKRRPMTMREIARRANMTWQRVARIAKQRTWAGITVKEADAFRLGCGITIENEWRHVAYLRRTFDAERVKRPLAHLDELPERYKARRLKLVS